VSCCRGGNKIFRISVQIYDHPSPGVHRISFSSEIRFVHMSGRFNHRNLFRYSAIQHSSYVNFFILTISLGNSGCFTQTGLRCSLTLNRAVFMYSSPPSIEDECLKCRRNFPAHFVDSDAISLITYGRRKVTLPIIRLYWVNSEACIQINSHVNKK